MIKLTEDYDNSPIWINEEMIESITNTVHGTEIFTQNSPAPYVVTEEVDTVLRLIRTEQKRRASDERR